MINKTNPDTCTWQPTFFHPERENDARAMEDLIKAKPYIQVHDFFENQLRELAQIRKPAIIFTTEELGKEIQSLRDSAELNSGVWVYYPWSEKLVHLLNAIQFFELRTVRNQYKITPFEQRLLATKKIGIIGLSVGQSIALAIAMERSAGELRLADFDHLELSNLNRIRTGIHNLGMSKVIITAREIMEIDPFLKIRCFDKGITDENIEDFLLKDGKLDILIDECDSLDVKINSRKKARQFGIPVLMDTSDRGMIDIERFDLEPGRPILHGLIDHLDCSNLKGLTNEQKAPFILAIIGTDAISKRLKASMMEVGQSITTWPQLGSSVLLGGAVGADTCRRILLDQLTASGRHFVDTEKIIGERRLPILENNSLIPAAINRRQQQEIAEIFVRKYGSCKGYSPSHLEIEQIVEAASLAPSGGNCQPWIWLYKKGYLFLFHDVSRSYSFLDYNHFATYLAFGSASENLEIKAYSLNIEVTTKLFPLPDYRQLAAVFGFSQIRSFQQGNSLINDLVNAIPLRLTNRKVSDRKIIDISILNSLKERAEAVDSITCTILNDTEKLERLSVLLGKSERIRLMHPRGHRDFVSEIRWTKKENYEKKDGIDIETVDLNASDRAALEILKDWEAVQLLVEWKGGSAIEKIMHKSIRSAAAVCLISAPFYSDHFFFDSGKALQKLWLNASLKGIGLQPVTPLTFLLARLNDGRGEELSFEQQDELKGINEELRQLFSINEQPIFLFRLLIADEPKVKSLRKPLSEIMTLHD